jgi:hypothetical protein
MPELQANDNKTTWRPLDVGVAVVIGFFGLLVRLRALLAHRSFWCDEAMLALNITRRGFRALLQPLDWNQAAPVGFLEAERLAVKLLGASEIALRIVPFLSGIGILILGLFLARRHLSRAAGLTAMLLLAASDTLIYYSNDLKQYESDAFLFLLFVCAMLYAYESGFSRRAVAAVAAVGAAVLFGSHTIFFAMGGFLLAACILDGPTELIRHWRRWGAIVLAWGAAFAVDYGYFLRSTASNTFLYKYWQSGFLPSPAFSAGSARWIVRSCYTNIAYAVGGEEARFQSALLLVCIILGAIRLWRDQRRLLLLLWSPFFLVFAASLVRRFPFEGRLITFLVPGCLITAAAAVDVLRQRWVLTLGLCLLPAIAAIDKLAAPERVEELRPVLQAIKPRIRPGDTIYVYFEGRAAFEYYRRLLDVPGLTIVSGVDPGDYFGVYEQDVERLRGHGRVWLVATHMIDFSARDEATLLTVPFARNGAELDRAADVGAVAILYRL